MANQKKERQKANRASRLEQAQAEQAQAKTRQRLIGYGVLAAVVIVAIAGIALLTKDDDETPVAGDPVAIDGNAECPTDETTERTLQFSEPTFCIDESVSYSSVIETTAGSISIELDSTAAPQTVNNYVFLARNNYYDSVTFHRVIPGFVIQTGDAVGNPPGTGGPGYSIPDELPTAEPYYEIGTVAMANSSQPDSGGSQFFIVTGEQGAALPPQYSVFGKVVDGMDVVSTIETGGSPDGTPVTEYSIVDVTIQES